MRHVALIFLTFVVLQRLRADPQETVGEVQERWQSAVLRDGEEPPAPWRACPPDLRATAQRLSFRAPVEQDRVGGIVACPSFAA